MRIHYKNRLRIFFISFCIATSLISMQQTPALAQSNQTEESTFTGFFNMLNEGNEAKAAKIGEEIFVRLEQNYRTDPGFNALKSKLAAAEFLSNQMVSQLKKATGRQVLEMAGELFENTSKTENNKFLTLAPAKNLYDSSLEVFSKPITIDVNSDEKKFLAEYYNLKLKIFTNAIAEAGLALSVSAPAFKGTHDYVLVLPLLHASEQKPVSIKTLPKWMQEPSQLEIFSDSCLLHYALPFHAMSFAKESATLQNKSFSEEEFYRNAAKKCSKQSPRAAVDCLQRACSLIKEENTEQKVNISFDIVQTWLDSENFQLAAAEAKKLSDTYDKNQQAGKAIWLYYYALSRAGNTESILQDIDSALQDQRCSSYKAKLMYIKWWALRRQRNEAARVAALEYQLLKEFGDDPMVAPILLSRATDLLAGQDYKGALDLLTQLQDKFPVTKAAQEGKKMIEKLKAAKDSN